MATQQKFADVQTYIDSFPPDVVAILQTIRATIQEAMPEAKELIRYNMPTMNIGGAYVYFAAFKKHIGLFPPVEGDEALQADLLRYRGEKGNLRFPLSEPMPYALILRAVRGIVKEYRERAAVSSGK